MKKNGGEEGQKLHKCFIEDFGPLTVQLFLKVDTEGDKTRGASNLYQYFTTRAKKATILRRRWLSPGSDW